MPFDKTLVREKLLNWEALLQAYTLPAWEDFPALPLYMDQVIYLMNQYLSLLPPEDTEERLVTPAMINNYVKLKIIPAPVKKRYGRVHLAYLLIVCMMKQTLNTGVIRRLLPQNPDEALARETYAAFLGAFQEIKDYFRSEVRRAAMPIFSEDGSSISQLVFQLSAAANLSKLLTEQLILLREEDQQEPAAK